MIFLFKELAELAELATLGAQQASSTRGRMPDSLGRWLRWHTISFICTQLLALFLYLVFLTVMVWLNWPIIEGSYWCQAACARLAGWSIQGRLLLNCHHLKISFSISSESDKSPCYIDCIGACGLSGCFTVHFPFQCIISSSWIKEER